VRAVGAFGFEHACERVEPLTGFLRVDVGDAVHGGQVTGNRQQGTEVTGDDRPNRLR